MMPTIIRSNNGTIITPYEKKQCYLLEKYTGVYDEVYHRRNELSGFRVDNYQGSSAFLTYRQKYDFLTANFEGYLMQEPPIIRPKKMNDHYKLNSDIVLSEIQSTIATELVTTAKTTREWFIHVQTGLGKTVLVSYYSLLNCKKTFITCFSRTVLAQWIKTFRTNTNMDMNRVLCIDSGSTLTDILNKKINADDYDIYICTPGLLTMWCDNNDYSYLAEVFGYLGIGLLVYDEAHRNMGNISKINAITNVLHTLYLSADYGQGDYQKEAQWLNIVRHAKVLTPDKELDEASKHTKIAIIDYNSNPNSIERDSIFNRYGFSSDHYMEYQFKRGIIFDVVKMIMNMVNNDSEKYRTLILLTQIKHVDIMTKILQEAYGDRMTIGRYHSQVDGEEKLIAREMADVIVSTYSSFGTGVDAPNIRYVIGLNQSNKIEDNQAAGRARPLANGKSAIYFIVVDRGFAYCSKKLPTRLSYLKSAKSKENVYVYHYYTAKDV